MSPSLTPAASDVMTKISDAYDVLDAAAPPISKHPIWGNSDVLVDQWRRELPGAGGEAVLMGIRIRRVAMVIDRMIIEQCESRGIKHHEFILMMALRRIGSPYALRPSDLLKMYSVTSGTATYRVDQLVKRDLVAREPDPTDRRGFLIRLTPHGKQVVDEILDRLRVQFSERMTPLAEIEGGFAMLEAGLRLFEGCILTPEKRE